MSEEMPVIRFAVSLAIILGSALLAAFGVGVLCFERAAVDVEKALERKIVRPDEAKAFADIGQWAKVPGMSARAIEFESALASKSGDQRRAGSSVQRLLIAAPTAGRYWLELAEFRYSNGAPISEALSALHMARITEPREPLVIAPRAFLSVRLWEHLTPDDQRASAVLLAELEGRLSGGQLAQLRGILDRKAPPSRVTIRNRLRTQGVSEPWLRVLGL